MLYGVVLKRIKRGKKVTFFRLRNLSLSSTLSRSQTQRGTEHITYYYLVLSAPTHSTGTLKLVLTFEHRGQSSHYNGKGVHGISLSRLNNTVYFLYQLTWSCFVLFPPHIFIYLSIFLLSTKKAENPRYQSTVHKHISIYCTNTEVLLPPRSSR